MPRRRGVRIPPAYPLVRLIRASKQKREARVSHIRLLPVRSLHQQTAAPVVEQAVPHLGEPCRVAVQQRGDPQQQIRAYGDAVLRSAFGPAERDTRRRLRVRYIAPGKHGFSPHQLVPSEAVPVREGKVIPAALLHFGQFLVQPSGRRMIHKERRGIAERPGVVFPDERRMPSRQLVGALHRRRHFRYVVIIAERGKQRQLSQEAPALVFGYIARFDCFLELRASIRENVSSPHVEQVERVFQKVYRVFQFRLAGGIYDDRDGYLLVGHVHVRREFASEDIDRERSVVIARRAEVSRGVLRRSLRYIPLGGASHYLVLQFGVGREFRPEHAEHVVVRFEKIFGRAFAHYRLLAENFQNLGRKRFALGNARHKSGLFGGVTLEGRDAEHEIALFVRQARVKRLPHYVVIGDFIVEPAEFSRFDILVYFKPDPHETAHCVLADGELLALLQLDAVETEKYPDLIGFEREIAVIQPRYARKSARGFIAEVAGHDRDVKVSRLASPESAPGAHVDSAADKFVKVVDEKPRLLTWRYIGEHRRGVAGSTLVGRPEREQRGAGVRVNPARRLAKPLPFRQRGPIEACVPEFLDAFRQKFFPDIFPGCRLAEPGEGGDYDGT